MNGGPKRSIDSKLYTDFASRHEISDNYIAKLLQFYEGGVGGAMGSAECLPTPLRPLMQRDEGNLMVIAWLGRSTIYREIVMTRTTSFVIASAMLALLPAGAAASEKPAIVVTAPQVTLTQWSGRVMHALDRNISYPMPIRGEPDEGVVSVKFLCSENGTPTGVAIVKSSGSRDLDASALRAVTRIATLHPLPEGIAHDQLFQANILYATSQKRLDRQVAALIEEARNRNAAIVNRPEKVALNIGFAAAR